MITFGLNYDVKQEFIEKFIQLSKDTIKAMQEMKGHVKTHIYSDVEKPNSFLIYSEWETQEDFTAFMRSAEFKSVQTMGIEMLEGRPRHKIYQTLNMSR